jgi:hypothetical protein
MRRTIVSGKVSHNGVQAAVKQQFGQRNSRSSRLPTRLAITNLPQSLNSSTTGSEELAAVVDDLLNQLNSKFTSVSSELLAKSTSTSKLLP